MSSIPSNLGRVPTMLASQLAIGNLNRTNLSLLDIQQQISSGLAISRPSDDIIKSASIMVMNQRLDRSTQVKRNLSHAASSLGVLDSLFNEANTLTGQARSIASEQVGVGSSAAERNSQAGVVDQMIQSLFNTANRQSVAGYALGGSQTTQPPVTEFHGGYRYNGSGSGLLTDLGMAAGAPITVGESAIAGTAQVRGDVDLNPDLTNGTVLTSLGGARGLGVTLGTIQFSVNGGPLVNVDLAGSGTVQDIATRVQAALHQYETDNSTTVLGPGGVSVSGGALSLDVAAGTPPTVPSVRFFDVGTGVTGKDLGLVGQATPVDFTSTSGVGADLNPRVTWQTPLASIPGLSGGLGSIHITNAGQTANIDLSHAQTLQDVRNAIEGAGVGVRVQLNQDGTGIDVINEVSAGSAQALSISEVTGTGMSATKLGIRTFSSDTRIQDFNFGRGVTVVDGQKDPVTGLITPALNSDFTIVLGDAANTKLTIDLRPQDMTTVQSVIDRINSQAAGQLAAAGLPPGSFSAGLADGANGLVLSQAPGFPTTMTVKVENNSPAAEQLGLLGAGAVSGGATLIGEDRTKVRVNSVFTQLIDLRDALKGNNTSGITLAGGDLGKSVASLVDTRGLVGGYARRVDEATVQETDRETLDKQTRSELQDVDYTTAATRFSLLQTQLEAGLRVTALAGSKSLMDFLAI